MRFATCLALVFTLLSCTAVPAPKPQSKPKELTSLEWLWYFGSKSTPFAEDKIVADAQRRMVKIATASGGCTGGILSTGRVLTAGHCFPDEGDSKDMFVDGQLATLVSYNKASDEDDYLFLKLYTDSFPALEVVDPKVDMEVFEVVIQGDFRGVVKRGRVTNIIGNMFATDIPSIPGSSGAFVYSKEGKLVGIITQLQSKMVVYVSAQYIFAQSIMLDYDNAKYNY